MEEIEKKMSKIIRKLKKIVNCELLENKIISHICMFFKRTFRNFQNSLIKSLILPIKNTTRNSIIFWQLWIGETEKKCEKC